eukprot:m.397068 g.397068  ORF g.397068 m.397068 type:complete len:165 (-) comp20104_c10_seq12:5258-5752(-)
MSQLEYLPGRPWDHGESDAVSVQNLLSRRAGDGFFVVWRQHSHVVLSMTARGVIKHLPIKYSDRGFVLNGVSLSATSSLDHLIQRLHDRQFVSSIPAPYRPPGPLKQGVPRGAGHSHDSDPDADYVNDHEYVNAAAQSGAAVQDGYHSVLTRNKQRQQQPQPQQ